MADPCCPNRTGCLRPCGHSGECVTEEELLGGAHAKRRPSALILEEDPCIDSDGVQLRRSPNFDDFFQRAISKLTPKHRLSSGSRESKGFSRSSSDPCLRRGLSTPQNSLQDNAVGSPHTGSTCDSESASERRRHSRKHSTPKAAPEMSDLRATMRRHILHQRRIDLLATGLHGSGHDARDLHVAGGRSKGPRGSFRLSPESLLVLQNAQTEPSGYVPSAIENYHQYDSPLHMSVEDCVYPSAVNGRDRSTSWPCHTSGYVPSAVENCHKNGSPLHMGVEGGFNGRPLRPAFAPARRPMRPASATA